jgi:hypothetical protein
LVETLLLGTLLRDLVWTHNENSKPSSLPHLTPALNVSANTSH